jgi:hypothetical protein
MIHAPGLDGRGGEAATASRSAIASDALNDREVRIQHLAIGRQLTSPAAAAKPRNLPSFRSSALED